MSEDALQSKGEFETVNSIECALLLTVTTFFSSSSTSKQYKPSDLLCPYSLKWVMTSSCLHLFEEATVPRLHDPEPEMAANAQGEERQVDDLSSAVVNVLNEGTMMRDRIDSNVLEKWRTALIEYVSRVGRELASRMVYIDGRTM